MATWIGVSPWMVEERGLTPLNLGLQSLNRGHATLDGTKFTVYDAEMKEGALRLLVIPWTSPFRGIIFITVGVLIGTVLGAIAKLNINWWWPVLTWVMCSLLSLGSEFGADWWFRGRHVKERRAKLLFQNDGMALIDQEETDG